ncbi:hypothetical protein BH20ACT1_BH20ACT1_08950 [soil metagenome]
MPRCSSPDLVTRVSASPTVLRRRDHALAATADPRIDAIAPRITWSSLDYSLGPNKPAGR